MILEKKLRILGIVSIILGLAAALLCVAPFAMGMFYGILLGFFGMVCSSIYVFIDTRNEINTKKFTAGILGMLLSSIPILLLLVLIIMKKMSS